MREYVLDANVLFSAILSGSEFYPDLLTVYRFYLPDFALTEIAEYEELIHRKTKVAPQNLKRFIIELFEKLVIIPRFLVSDESILKAYGFCRDVDAEDTMYVALSLELGLPLVTRDKELCQGLMRKGFESVVMFDSLADGMI